MFVVRRREERQCVVRACSVEGYNTFQLRRCVLAIGHCCSPSCLRNFVVNLASRPFVTSLLRGTLLIKLDIQDKSLR